MKNKFYCQKCRSIFNSEGRKFKYQDPIYGPCWKRIASCPTCHLECDELYQKKPSSKNADFDSYVSDLKNQGGGCCNGGGCCG